MDDAAAKDGRSQFAGIFTTLPGLFYLPRGKNSELTLEEHNAVNGMVVQMHNDRGKLRHPMVARTISELAWEMRIRWIHVDIGNGHYSTYEA